MRFTLIFAFMAAGTTAVADCPSRDDLKGGIRFTDSSGETETFKSGRRDRLNSYVAYNGERVTSYELLHGQFTVLITDFENGRPLPDAPHARHTYKPRPPAPRPNTTWAGVSHSRDGADRYQTKETHVMGALKTFTIGGCTYNSFPITVTYLENDDTETEISEYLVDLGIGLMVRRWDQDGTDDRYRYTDVTAVQ